MLAIGDDLFSIKLQKTLLELESNLKLVTHGEGDENIKVILSVEDEVGYWKTFGEKRDIKKSEKEAASAFCVLFEDICEEIRCLPSIGLQEVRDSAENIGGILDDVWRYSPTPYSQDRMVHIFDIVGHVICSVTQQAVSRTDLWRVHHGLKDNEILHQLTEALAAVKVWVSTCKTLTDTYWPNYSLHEWKGKPYVPVFCQNFQKRLEEIHSIRSTFNQLSKLLAKSERTELNSDQLLEPFKNINVWIYNGHNQMWENAVSRFSSSIRPAEAKIAEKLKPRLQNLSTKQSLYEFSRYRTLLSRPLVQQALTRELELFLSSLLTMMKDVKSHLEEDLPGLYHPPEMTDLVVKVQWARQMEDKVKEIESCVGTDLRNLEGSDEVLQLAAKVQNDLKNTYTQLYEEWSRDVQAQLRAGSLQLSERPVVEFSSADRLMVVNYPEGLERVEREARALLAAGLPPPPGALTGLTASLRYARALHQVASFHNTLGERAVSSTRPMLLHAALQLAALVADHRPPSWTDERALHEYTQQLKEKVMELEKQNNYLTSQHLKIRSIVEKLMDTELLAKLAEWKKGIKDIRDIIEKVEANGYENTEMWRSHWDLQLYKAMECQYMKALLSLHSHFPALRVDLVLRSGRVRSQPSEEELRARLYSLLRRLVTLPAGLPGLASTTDTDTNTTSVFSSIVEKHSWLGNKAVSQLEGTLANLERACERWTRRAALGCVRLKDLCDQLTSPEQWEINFRACKAYGQSVAKMTFEDEKIEWITVGTVTLRREFEAQARNLWACLMTSLTASCRGDSTALDSFMTAASVTLEDKTLPKNTKELAEISAKQQALQKKMPEMEKMVEDLKRKSHLARTWGGDTTLDGVTREWSKLKETMTAHQTMFEHQAEIVKTTLSGDCENLRSALEAWAGRWSRHDVRETTYDGLVAASHDVKHALDGWNTLADQWAELQQDPNRPCWLLRFSYDYCQAF
ncbi:cytoplasmic dynein 2 heavy chain 1-like [Danaus plexippus]|uniref:cytoplasmic dynein 2 heavy chain 1-like n=1 Tax=Danaus plexippus TaxID=13037 RepID=UPI002AB0081E|nr:cytoplasmic dynein 2 heavy chain 1-like [Danaus plexippus]